MVELDHAVAALWKTILSDDSQWLVDSIMSFDMSLESVREELSKKPTTVR